MLKCKFQKKNLAQGFTLIEMMVSLALFTVVMLAGTGTMLVVLDANRKAQAFQIAMDNLGVALEGISRDMRVGTHFYCLSGTLPGTTNADCAGGGTSFAFLPYGKSNLSTNYWVYRWRLVSGKGVLERCQKGSNCLVDSDYSALTAPEIDIRHFTIYVRGSNPKSAGDSYQSRALIAIQGVAGGTPKTQTEFSVQTTISQFQLDL